MSDILKQLNRDISRKMEGIAKILPPEYRLTLVARNTGTKFTDADIVLTDDDLLLAIKAIERLRFKDPVIRIAPPDAPGREGK